MTFVYLVILLHGLFNRGDTLVDALVVAAQRRTAA
jgi:hypothetical protein